ncbi:transmembrane protein C16orf54 homolog [Carettochelys insculpta]|uniref:transmembrane protein C16orf54 homolog n=1 Tax=Carettochelys insculpta TaxID=44489 RepID=UPI003EB89ACD
MTRPIAHVVPHCDQAAERSAMCNPWSPRRAWRKRRPDSEALCHGISHIPPAPRLRQGTPPSPSPGSSLPPTSCRGPRLPLCPALSQSTPMAPSLPPSPRPSPPSAMPCTACLVPMLALAGVAGLFLVLCVLLAEQLLRGARARGVPSVWRRGGELWIEPPAPPPLDQPPPAKAAQLWIPHPAPDAADWYRDPGSGSGSGTSSGVHSGAPESTGSAAALWDSETPTWGAQPHITLQDITNFFQRGGGGLGRAL